MATWIDFKALKAQLRIADVLAHHGVQLKVRGEQASGYCPLPDHADSKTPSFSAHLGRNCFQCFGCHRAGNALDLELCLRGLDPADTKAVRKVAMELIERHGLILEGKPNQVHRRKPYPVSQRPNLIQSRARPQPSGDAETDDRMNERSDEGDSGGDSVDANTIVNPPLGFVLQHLDPAHPYLFDRGFTAETIEQFGLGFCGKGMLKDRMAIPLHDPAGQLVGYAGRAVDDRAIGPEHPKYLFPGTREKGKQKLVFRKSQLLYNAHRIVAPAAALVIVEGFTSVWWLWQHGFPNAVALMGSSASAWQVQQIAALTAEHCKLLMFTDGDEAGVDLARDLIPQLAARRWTTWVKLLPDEQPTDIAGNDLKQLLAT